MTPATIITLGMVISIALIGLSLGTRATLGQAFWLSRHPSRLLRATLAIYLVMPASAVLLCLSIDMAWTVQFALIAMAVSPLPPILPARQESAGGHHRYVISLLITMSLFAIVLTPLVLALAARVLGVTATISPLEVGRILFVTVAAPLATGMALKRYAPALAEVVHEYLWRSGNLLLVVAVAVLLFNVFPELVALIGNGTILVFAATVAIGLIAGHLLAGGDQRDRAALAIATVTRHPGVAIAIAGVNFADQKRIAVAAVVLFLLVNVIVTIPYIRWVRRQVNAGRPEKGTYRRNRRTAPPRPQD